MHSQGAVEWRVPIVWEMNEDDAQSKKCDVAVEQSKLIKVF